MNSLSMLPPRHRLELVLASLCRNLPGQLGVLIDDHRFNDARNPLMRLADSRWAAEAASSMSEEEAGWLADQLWSRWQRIGQPTLEPTARLVIPEEVWVGERPVRKPIQLVVLGMEDGWRVRWQGPVIASKPPILLAEPPRSGAWVSRVQVEISGTVQGRPRQLSLHAEVRLRRPVILFDDNQTCLAIRDQDGLPAGTVSVQIGDVEYQTSPEGLVFSQLPFPTGARVWVAGISMGSVPRPTLLLDEPTVEVTR